MNEMIRDEIAVDNYLKKIAEKSGYVRYIQTKKIELTESEKDEIKKLPKEQREEKEKALLKKKEEEKYIERLNYISEMESMIRSSDLPEETKSNLLNMLQEARVNGGKISAQVNDKIKAEIEKENVKKQAEEQKAAENVAQSMAGAATVAVVTAAAVVAAKTAEATPERRKAYLENNVAQKAGDIVAQELGKKQKDITLEDIQNSKKLLNVQKRYATKKYIENHPALKKDMQIEESAILQKGIERLQRKAAEKEAKAGGYRVQKNSNPHYMDQFTEEEKALIKKVKKIKQKGQAVTMMEVKAELAKTSPEDAEAYTVFMRKHHPELFENQMKEEAEKVATRAPIEERKARDRAAKTKEGTSLKRRASLEKPRTRLEQNKDLKNARSDLRRVLDKLEKTKQPNARAKQAQKNARRRTKQNETTFIKTINEQQMKNVVKRNKGAKNKQKQVEMQAVVNTLVHVA